MEHTFLGEETAQLTYEPRGEWQARAKIAVYSSPDLPPDIVEFEGTLDPGFLTRLSEKVCSLVSDGGGCVDPAIVKELVDNFLHADLKGAVVSILGGGQVLKFADRGPGIADKERALQPGVGSPCPKHQSLIRGVGSGLSLARHLVREAGGELSIEDNLGSGTVVTVELPRKHQEPVAAEGRPSMSGRQNKILSLLLELRETGPSRIAEELGVSLSSIYRDLRILEQSGLLATDPSGRRTLTEMGVEYLSHDLSSAG